MHSLFLANIGKDQFHGVKDTICLLYTSIKNMEKLLAILEDMKPGVDFKKEKKLIEDGILDSFDIVEIIAAIDDEFDVEIPVMEVQPEVFNDVEKLYALIERLMEE